MARPRMSERRHAVAAVAAVLAVFTTALLGLLSGTASAAPAMKAAAASAPAAGPHAAASAAAGPAGRVVVIGVPGLRWSDVRPSGTPNLWRLAGQGAVGALSVKTVAGYTCPIDGWLTVSAGQRSQLRHGSCGLPPAPAGNAVPGYARIRDDNAHNKYASKIGLLGDAVHRAGGCTMAVGPGAAFGAADRTGRVDGYAASVAQVAPADWGRCALTMVDVDDVFRAYIDAGVDVNGRQVQVTGRKRAAAATRADAQIGRILTALPQGTTVLIAGLSDNARSARLHVAVATGAGYTAPRYLTADSTRTDGLVTLTDLTATVLHGLDIARPKDAVGSPWRPAGGAPTSASGVVRALDDRDAAARGYSHLVFPFYIALIVVQVALYAVATVALRRKGHRLLAATKVFALAVGALPVASFLVNLVPWWSGAHPGVVMTVLAVVGVAVVTAVAAAGPWRRSVTGAGAVVAGVTALTLSLDVMTGNHLQNCTMLGYTPLVAGRFYGFGNTTWGLWITGLILAAGALAGRLLAGTGGTASVPDRAGTDGPESGPEGEDQGATGGADGAGRRRAATALVIGAGVLALVIDGAPMWGADFGGMIAAIPGFAVFAFMVSGRRTRPSRLLAVLGAGAVLVLGAAFLDSLRANPTHIGEFWKTLTGGDAGTVLVRKFSAMIGTFGNWKLSVIAVAALGFLFFALLRPLAWRAAALHTAYERAPALRATLAAVLVTAGVGMLVNDSGVAIPAMAVMLAVPLALAASVRALELHADGAPARPARSQEASTPKA